MEWGDVLTIVLILLALWTFIPKAARRGVGPVVHSAADGVRAVYHFVAPYVSRLAYEGLIGVKQSEMGVSRHYVTNGDDPPADYPVAPPLATTATEAQQFVATPQTDSNDLLLRAKAETLAALVLTGKVGETEGLKIVYGVTPSSSNPRYIAARAALKEAMAQHTGEAVERDREARLRTVAREAIARRG